MEHRKDIGKNRPQSSEGKECSTCLYVNPDNEAGRENCLRFARFVDHALHESSRECDYWTPNSEQSSVNSG